MNQQEFHSKIPEWIAQPKDRWNHITLMAYFCHKYYSKHGVQFRLVRWKGDPGKGKESRDFSKLFNLLVPEDYDSLSGAERSDVKLLTIKKIYNYINWMFDFKFRRGERSVTGTGLFLLPSMINEFERMYSNHLSLKKQDNAFGGLVRWAEDNVPRVLDEHELESLTDVKMIESYIESYSLGTDSPEAVFVRKAKEMGVI